METQVRHDALTKEMKEFFLYTEGDYLHIIEKLKVLNRKAMPVIDILREMRYTEPQVPPTMLRKETKELFFVYRGRLHSRQ